MLNLTINGEQKALPGPMSVAQLLETLGFDRHKVAVEVNKDIVPRPAQDQCRPRPRRPGRDCHLCGRRSPLNRRLINRSL